MTELTRCEKPQGLPLRECSRTKAKLVEIVANCFILQNTYGKRPSDLQIITPFFARILQDFTQETIENAFEQFIKQSPEFPAPADIYKICVEMTAPKWWELGEKNGNS